jgi:stage II sporulation protein AA (anti-sigma F factor antagonist)
MSTASPFVQLVDDHVVVTLEGEVDLAVRTALTESYDVAITLLEVPHVLIDVSRVTFMDSTGMDTLAAALNKVNARGGTISVTGASARIVRLLRITHMDGLVTILPPSEPAPGVAVGDGIAVAVA